MNNEPMMIDETEDFVPPRRSTQRSWKIFQFVVAGLLSVFVVAMMLADHGGETFGGATEASIAKFEQAMSDYFDAVKRRGLAEVTMSSYSPITPNEVGRVVEFDKGTDEARRRLQEVVADMNYSNERKAEAAFVLSARLHNKGSVTSEELMEGMSADRNPWVMRNIPAGVWLALKTAVITFIAAWLLLKMCELFWWFLMDRVHDVANAVRKRQDQAGR